MIQEKSKETRLGCFYVMGILYWKCGWGLDCVWVWFEAEIEVRLSLGWGWSLVKVDFEIDLSWGWVEVKFRVLMRYFWSRGRVQNCFGVYSCNWKIWFSIVPSILTFNFKLISDSFFLFWALLGYFWGCGRVQKLFWGLLIQTNKFCFQSTAPSLLM